MLITDLIDRRYGELNPTVICSNLNEEQLSKFFGERAWDRLMQNGAIIPITGKSNR
jgi:DNA replication protein DnaC